MKILVACEESQTVTKALRVNGHEAFSCDIQDCSGGHPEWHFKCSVFDVLYNGWDAMIGHPPCTYLSIAGNRYFNIERYGAKAKQRWEDRHEAVAFFKALWDAPIKYICLENPLGYLNVNFRKPDQIVHPYFFGDSDKKRTCFWLKNLPPLVHIKQDDLFDKKTHAKEPEPYGFLVHKGSKWHKEGSVKKLYYHDIDTNQKRRSKTFNGIAKAMADQWFPKESDLPMEVLADIKRKNSLNSTLSKRSKLEETQLLANLPLKSSEQLRLF